MICSLRRGGAKRLALTAEIKHESQNKNDQSKPRMTLKGSNLHTKNNTTINHNPVGVEFRKNAINRLQNKSSLAKSQPQPISKLAH
jgi:hypothetical protein